jgi:two-component system sensor histidine kinase MprB
LTLRNRVTLAAGIAVLVAVIAVSVTVFLVVRGNLRDQIDDYLRDHATQQRDVPLTASDLSHLPLVEDVFVQVVDDDGEIVAAFDDRPLPVTAAVGAVARGERDEAWFDAEVDGMSVRIVVTSPQPGVAFQVGRSLEDVDEALRNLLVALVVISLAAVGLAALIGRLVAAAAAAPVHRVARAADAVARTGDLSHHLDVPGGDDLGRLAGSFNTMLDALSESLARQRRLVADASHELRTPLATVRTNVEVLARADELEPGERATLIRETVVQIGELTRLVGDMVELARGDGEDEPFTRVDLYQLTRTVVDLVGRNQPTVTLRLEGTPSPIRGAPGRVARAVSNLIDNAAKWSPAGGTVEIDVDGGAVTVRDHGPGIDPADQPRIFDRFYRSPAARTMPGSGLGLAIVKQVADSHGGTVSSDAPPGGGARFILRFPTAAAPAQPEREVPTQLSSPS